MPNRQTAIHSTALAAILLFLAGPALATSNEKVLYSFCPTSCKTDGDMPYGAPILDAAGNLYGTTYNGGENDSGTVFELSPGPGGTWTETTLFNFPNCDSGSLAGLTFDASGNLYGTTFSCGSVNGGTVFELSPGTNGWTEKVLHSFGSGHDGWGLGAGVIFDSAGNLYGTTNEGGANGTGIVFELIPNGNGDWTEKIIYNFGKFKGTNSPSGLIFDSAGNLYGTSAIGGGTGCGGSGCGMVFELSPSGNGRWTEKTLHAFSGNDGTAPYAVIFDGAGNLYGTTYYGGSVSCNPPNGCGVIYELSPGANGKWTETVLRKFYIKAHYPVGQLAFDANGNLYGTTVGGGPGCGGGGCGLVFKLTPAGNREWSYSLVYFFRGGRQDGNYPYSGVVFDPAGNMYGTTNQGGAGIWNVGCGTVYEITP